MVSVVELIVMMIVRICFMWVLVKCLNVVFVLFGEGILF